MSLETQLQREWPAVEAAIDAMLQTRPWPRLAPDDAFARQSTMLADALGSGGKRMRALLPALLVRAGGGPVDAAVRLGAAIELVHNGTLVHDDIQDGDTLRRGRPTLWRVHGQAQAINIGNLLLVAPITALAGDPTLPAGLGPRLANLLGGALLETITGQIGDLDVHGNASADLARLEAVAMAKTAPLFGVAIQGAALLLGVDRPEPAQRAAQALGLAFQLRDDLLDLLGTKGRGAAGADLREGKPTMPMWLALADAPASEGLTIRATLSAAAAGKAVEDAEIAGIVATIRERGGLERGQARLATLLDQARSAGAEALPALAAEVWAAFADRLAVLDG